MYANINGGCKLGPCCLSSSVVCGGHIKLDENDLVLANNETNKEICRRLMFIYLAVLQPAEIRDVEARVFV